MQLLLASPYLLWMLLNPLLLFTCVAAWAPAQQTFATEVQPQAVAPPPLEVRPLFLSGPTGNRVDLVFLADGCKCSSARSTLYPKLTPFMDRPVFGKGQVLRRCTVSC